MSTTTISCLLMKGLIIIAVAVSLAGCGGTKHSLTRPTPLSAQSVKATATAEARKKIDRYQKCWDEVVDFYMLSPLSDSEIRKIIKNKCGSAQSGW